MDVHIKITIVIKTKTLKWLLILRAVQNGETQ